MHVNRIMSCNWGEPGRSLTQLSTMHSDGIIIRDHGSDLYVGIDMVKNYCLYKWYGRCSAKKEQKLSQITPN